MLVLVAALLVAFLRAPNPGRRCRSRSAPQRRSARRAPAGVDLAVRPGDRRRRRAPAPAPTGARAWRPVVSWCWRRSCSRSRRCRRPGCGSATPARSPATPSTATSTGRPAAPDRMAADPRHLARRRLPGCPSPRRRDRRPDRGRRHRGRARDRPRLEAARMGPARVHGHRARRDAGLLALRVAVDRGQGVRDRLPARARARARRGGLGVRARAAGSRRCSGRPRSCSASPGPISLAYHDVVLAPNARLTELQAIGKPLRRPGPDAGDRLRPVRRPALPAQARRRGSRRSSASAPVYLRTGAVLVDRGVAGRGRDPTPGPARLPHARDPPVACGEPPAVRLPAGRRRAVLRGLAAARHRRAADRASTSLSATVSSGPPSRVARRPAARTSSRPDRTSGGGRPAGEHRPSTSTARRPAPPAASARPPG